MIDARIAAVHEGTHAAARVIVGVCHANIGPAVACSPGWLAVAYVYGSSSPGRERQGPDVPSVATTSPSRRSRAPWAGEHGRRIVRITQFHQHPVHDGVRGRSHPAPAGPRSHRLHLVQVAQGIERLHQREVRQRGRRPSGRWCVCVCVCIRSLPARRAGPRAADPKSSRMKAPVASGPRCSCRAPRALRRVLVVQSAGIRGRSGSQDARRSLTHDRPVQVGEVVSFATPSVQYAVQPLLVVAWPTMGVAGLVVAGAVACPAWPWPPCP